MSSVPSLFTDEPLLRSGSAPTEDRVAITAEDMSALTVPQLVEQILQINKTASAAYLHQFARSELRHYLEHLVNSQRPRGRDAVWVRREAGAGILAADPLD
jgi:predicted exporter